jgi:hypothetical protein
MSVWDKTTPVHAKAASVDPYYFMLAALTKVAELTPTQRLKQTQAVGKARGHEPKDTFKTPKYAPIIPAMKVAFTESAFSGGLGPYGPLIMRNASFQSSLPGRKFAGPDPEDEAGEPERYPDKEEKRASLWKAAHFSCSAVAAWERRQSLR